MNSAKLETNNYEDGILRIAFATNDMKNINSHFGSATQFVIYNISKKSSSFCKTLNIKNKDTDDTILLLKDIDIVYFTNIGAIAAAKIINKGIFPIKYKEVISIKEEVNKLSTMLNSNPPPFIQKIISKKAS